MMTELDGKYLLVSDSNETSNEYDSRKLSYRDFLKLGSDTLFKSNPEIMDDYLVRSHFRFQSAIVENALNLQRTRFQNIGEWSGRFRVVDGQVIFVDVDEFEKLNNSLPPDNRFTPSEYVKTMWDVTQEYRLTQVVDCTIRGVTDVVNESSNKPANARVGLKEENMPPHMHHSGITRNADIQSMNLDNNDQTRNVSRVENGQVYDVFKNDSFAVGLDRNELDGVVDEFNVLPSGKQDTSGEEPKVFHDNLPPLGRYYAFVVEKA